MREKSFESVPDSKVRDWWIHSLVPAYQGQIQVFRVKDMNTGVVTLETAPIVAWALVECSTPDTGKISQSLVAVTTPVGWGEQMQTEIVDAVFEHLFQEQAANWKFLTNTTEKEFKKLEKQMLTSAQSMFVEESAPRPPMRSVP